MCTLRYKLYTLHIVCAEAVGSVSRGGCGSGHSATAHTKYHLTSARAATNCLQSLVHRKTFLITIC